MLRQSEPETSEMLKVTETLKRAYSDCLKLKDDRTNLFLVHTFGPSQHEGQAYEVLVYLMRHVWGRSPNQTSEFKDVDHVYFYFVPKFNDDKVFSVPNNDESIVARLHAWGTFLATCLVAFKDKSEPIVLYRYIDFEMAKELDWQKQKRLIRDCTWAFSLASALTLLFLVIQVWISPSRVEILNLPVRWLWVTATPLMAFLPFHLNDFGIVKVSLTGIEVAPTVTKIPHEILESKRLPR